jgi:hypothetical protein
MTADDAHKELRALRATNAWAFAHAAGCTYGRNPDLDWVLERERDLVAVIREHEADPI